MSKIKSKKSLKSSKRNKAYNLGNPNKAISRFLSRNFTRSKANRIVYIQSAGKKNCQRRIFASKAFFHK